MLSIIPLIVQDPKPCADSTSLECMITAGSTTTLGPTGGLWHVPPLPQASPLQLTTPTLCSWNPKGSYDCSTVSTGRNVVSGVISTLMPSPTFGQVVSTESFIDSLPITGSVRTFTVQANNTITIGYTSSLQENTYSCSNMLTLQPSKGLTTSTTKTTITSLPTGVSSDTTDPTSTGQSFSTTPVNSSGLRKVKNPFWFLVVVCAGSALYASGIWRDEPRKRETNAVKNQAVEGKKSCNMLKEYETRQDVEPRTEGAVERKHV